jgi:CheY-like chemotaxis protein
MLSVTCPRHASALGTEGNSLDSLALPRTTILVVEDDAPTRDLYRQALLTAGYNVVAVEDGVDALRRIEGDTPDAVVLDLMLPRLGGRDVYKELRSREETRNIPVVIVTGTDTRDLDPNDFRYFLRKPIHPDALIVVVDNAVRRSAFS